MMSVSGKPLNSALIECSYCYPAEVVKELRNVQAMYKNLSVCFDFYCHGTGVKSKLVHLNGTIPVACRGLIYNVPISIWLHNTHPQNPPRCFVKGLPIPCRNPGIQLDNTGMISSSYLCKWKYPASHLVGLIEDIRTSLMNCLNNPTQSALSQAQFPPNSLAMRPQPSYTIVPSIGNGYQSLQNIPQPLNSGCLQPVYSNKWPLSCQHQGSDNSVSPARISPSSSLLPSRSLREAVKGKSDHAMKKKMDSVEQTADLFKDLELDKVLNAFNLVTSSRNKQGVADKFSSDQIELEDAKPLRLYDAQNSSLFEDKRRVHVLNIPVELPWNRMKDKLTIFFQRAKNGGGEIVDFRYPTRIPGSAVITFDDAKVAERIVQQEHHVIIINDKNFTMQAKLYNEKDGALAEDDSVKILPEDMAHTCQNWLDLQSIPVDLPREKSEMFQRLLSLQDQNFNADDVMEVVHSGLNYESALRYLSHECPICREHVSFSKIVTMTHCSCSFCQDCFRKYFSSVIKEKSIISSVCPLCSTPDLKSHHLQEDVTEYFNLLDIQIRHYLDEETHELFQRKLRDRTLMEMPNFRWCAHCSFGLLHEIDRLRIDCPSCKKSTCFHCNIPWEQQHEGISCEKFKIWKQQNNPEYQASKLESYLTKNGIECPNCRVRFDLSRGGCIHFNCTECHHQFCGGCKRPFKLGSDQKTFTGLLVIEILSCAFLFEDYVDSRTACTFMSNCQTMGLHAHHPRDCFYHLRDWSVERLQKLLHTEHISLTAFLSDNSPGQVEGKCKVMEQKETSHGLKDEQCGHPSVKGYKGFCKIHFKQFLVELINKNSLDPAILYSKEEMLTELQRWGVTSPNQHVDELEEQFTQRLRIKIMNELKLDNQQKAVFDKSS